MDRGRRPRLAVVVGAVALVFAATGAVAAVRHENGGRRLSVVEPTLPPTPTVLTTAPAASTTAPAPSTTALSTTATSTPAESAITGTVADSRGRPVADAYVIGLDSRTVVRTDGHGHYAMPCDVTANGMVGRRLEPLAASPWLLPIGPLTGSYTVGGETTSFGRPPTTAGLGYAFSGGAADAAHASPASCDGKRYDFVLQPGGGADIELLDGPGAPATSSDIPPDNLYLPGLGKYAALETSPLDAAGHQHVQQMGGGVLRLDGTTSSLSCTGPGVTANPSVAGADVVIVPGQTVRVTCRLTS